MIDSFVGFTNDLERSPVVIRETGQMPWSMSLHTLEEMENMRVGRKQKTARHWNLTVAS